MKLRSYLETRDWVEGYIPKVYTRGELGLERIENLLEKLGNPERKFKSIHVAGTSAKGSAAFYIARLLQGSSSLGRLKTRDQRSAVNLHSATSSQNPEIAHFSTPSLSNFRDAKSKMKIGLHISPHLVDIRERMTINGKMIPIKNFVELFGEIKNVVEKIEKEKPKLTPSYFEILTAATFSYFAKERVDWAVVEVVRTLS